MSWYMTFFFFSNCSREYMIRMDYLLCATLITGHEMATPGCAHEMLLDSEHLNIKDGGPISSTHQRILSRL